MATQRRGPLGPLQQPKFTSALIVAALLFVIALVAGALYELDRSHREAEARAAHEIDALARVFAEQTRRSLQTVDTMLRSVADAHHDGKLPPLASRAMHDELAAQRDQFSDVAAVFLMDAQGPAAEHLDRLSAAGIQRGARQLDPWAASRLARQRIRGGVGALDGDRPLGPACGAPPREIRPAFRRRSGGPAGRQLFRQLLRRRAPGARHVGRPAARRRRPGVDVSAATGGQGRPAGGGVPGLASGRRCCVEPAGAAARSGRRRGAGSGPSSARIRHDSGRFTRARRHPRHLA
jgi:hypothetical protein